MDKEDVLLLKRFVDLSRISYQRGIPTYTNFLSLHEQNILICNEKELQTHFTFIGGYEFAERKMACFCDEYFDSTLCQPYSILKITPQNSRFAETLSHRDYLGALMNLGIEREVLGDIITSSSLITYIICKDSMANYIADNYTTVRHTQINCDIIDDPDALSTLNISPNFEEVVGSVSSLRIDCILSLAFNKSRTQISDNIKSGLVYVNSRLTESPSYILKENDTVSMRGYGKFIFKETGGLSKKGKTYIKILKYA